MQDNFWNLKMIMFIICFLILLFGLLRIMIKDKRKNIFIWIKYIPLIFFLLALCTVFLMAGNIFPYFGAELGTLFFGMFGISNVVRINRELKVCTELRKIKSLRSQRIVSVIIGIYGILVFIVDFI